MKKMNKILSVFLAIVMVVSLLPFSALAVVENEKLENIPSSREEIQAVKDNYPTQAGDVQINAQPSVSMSGEVIVEEIENTGADLKQQASSELEVSLYEDDEIVRVIVVLEEESLLELGYTTQQISENSGAVASAAEAMQRSQAALMLSINAAISDYMGGVSFFGVQELEAKYNYNVAISGVAVEVPYGVLEDIRQLDGVKEAFVAPQYSLPEEMPVNVADPSMINTKDTFGSAQTWSEMGYTGAGMRIVVVDTGLDLDHPSFVGDPAYADTCMDSDDIAAVLESLNAYKSYMDYYGKTLTVDDLYRSLKVPYAFNYVDVGLDVTHDNDYMGDHGTHVAGIAAANSISTTDVVGVAPDAQILVMKVFGQNGGAYFDDILASLEDAFRLNADAVNMSLGSPAGFTNDSDYAAAIFAKIQNSDMIVAVSAGNSTSAALMNGWGTHTNLTGDPDNGIVSSPATYIGSTVVASLENDVFMSNYLVAGGQKLAFVDVAAYLFTDLAGVEYEYVLVPGLGEASDYEGLDVEGKIAVVERGVIAFTDKQYNAYMAGAAGLIVYDNVDGDLISMQDGGYLPNVFVSKASGEALIAAAGDDGIGTLEVMPIGEVIAAPSPLAGTISDFSSVGVTPDLRLVPDVAAPGGNIYSTYTNGQYGTMSGTSMSAPHIAGMSALMLQYLREEHPELTDESEIHTVAEALIMSTAQPVVEPAGQFYSPRKQGAGAANVYSALNSPVYLTVDGGKPTVSFGDDDAKAGVYSFSFELNNYSDTEVLYRLDGDALTDQVDETYADYGLYFMSETSRALDAEFTFEVSGSADVDVVETYDYNEDGRVNIYDVQDFLDDVNYDRASKYAFDLVNDNVLDTADVQALYELVNNLPTETVDVLSVPAGGTVNVTVTLTLSAEDMAYMDTYYENGIYVDGFVRCYAINEGCDLSLPFMGFYGDWSAARIFEYDAAWDVVNGYYDRYFNVLWADYGDYGWSLGMNPYIADEGYDIAHNVLSPNGDGYLDYVNDVYLGLMRNAKAMQFTWTDEEGDELDFFQTDWARKSYYNSYYGINYPYIMSYDSEYYGYEFYRPTGFEDGTVLTWNVTGYLDDGDDVADDSISMPVIIDTTAPVIVGEPELVYDASTNTRVLKLTVADNYDVAALIPLSYAGSAIEYFTVEETETITVDGVEMNAAIMEIDVSGYDAEFTLVVADYGCNENYYSISFPGNPSANTDAFYGYRQLAVVPQGDYLYVIGDYNGWHSFETADSMTMHTSMYLNAETSVNAAEYIDGYVIGVDVNGQIFAMKAGYWNRMPLGEFMLDGVSYPALDMAYDYVTDTLFVLTDELEEGEGGHLATIDYLTGEVTDLGVITGMESQALTLACDNDGVLYAIDYLTGDLYTIDAETLTGSFVGETGYVPQYQQSMTVDHETNELYWMAYAGYTNESGFFKVDKATGELTDAQDVEWNSNLTALYKPYTPAESIIPDGVEPTGLALNEDRLLMAVGSARELICSPVPYYAELGEVTWTSSDESVALVYDGIVYAVGEGSAVITASANGLSVSCPVTASVFISDMVYFDMANTYMWTGVNAADTSSIIIMENAVKSWYGFMGAAYYNGWIYAGEQGGGFYRLDPTTMTGIKIGSSNTNLLAMAFNYTDGFMYALEMRQVSPWEPADYYLVRVNLNNGEIAEVMALPVYDAWTGENIFGTVSALAIDHSGNFYIVSINYDTSTYELLKFQLDGDEIVNLERADMGYQPYAGYSSLVYSAENDGMFWANDTGHLIWINADDMSDLKMIDLGALGEDYGYGMNMALTEIPTYEPETPVVAPETINVPNGYSVLVGGSVSANLTMEPWNASADVAYTTGDSNIAVVDADGIITGVAPGTTELAIYVPALDITVVRPITVTEAAGTLYGYLALDFSMYGYGYMWVNFSDTDPSGEYGYDAEIYDWAPLSGAYYDGKLYAMAQDQLGDYSYKNYLISVDINNDYAVEIIAKVHENIRDMSFDYTTGNMYGIFEGGIYTGALAQVDLTTGNVAVIGDTGIKLTAMTIDAEGNMYVVAQDDNLYQVDKYTAELTLIGDTGLDAGKMYQSMHYDHNSGNTYWSYAGDDYTSGLYLVDLGSGSTTYLGTITPSGAGISALYTVPENEATTPDMDTLEVVDIQLPESATVVVGETIQLDATVLAEVELNGDMGTMGMTSPNVGKVDVELLWTSSDESVATVDATGLVTGASAGTAVISAAYGNTSAKCTVVVTEEGRLFYAYDKSNGQWISFSQDDGEYKPVERYDYNLGSYTENVLFMNVNVERADAEGEGKLLASIYTGETIYAYDESGLFYSVDPDSFERTLIGSGISEKVFTIDYEEYDWRTEETYIIPVELTVNIQDMSYDNGKLYAVLNAENDDYWIQTALFCEVDLSTGEMTVLVASDEVRPGNLLVIDGTAFLVDTYMSGMLTTIDLYAENPVAVQQSLVQGYWGSCGTSAGLIMDECTGVVYAIRDKVDPDDWGGEWSEDWEWISYWDGVTGEAELCILNLGDADINVLGYIGDGTLLINGLFLR